VAERCRQCRAARSWTAEAQCRIVYAVSDLREWVELGAKRSTSDPATVLPAKPVDKRATKLDRGMR
jgi:hypothetical protein